MGEHTFDHEDGAGDAGEFDYALLLCELRRHSNEWIERYRTDAVAEQRRGYVRELAAIAILDERGRMDDSVAEADGVSVPEARAKIDTARRLADLPEMAAAAYSGAVSPQQMEPAAQMADPSTDGEWARKAATTSPVDLKRELRAQKAPTPQEFAARRAQRSLRWWWNEQHAMLSLRGELPDLAGHAVETVLEHMVNGMRPAKGEAWETRDRRGADALVDLCVNYADVQATAMPEPLFVLHWRPGEPFTIGGAPLPDELVEALFPTAMVEGVLTDVHGSPVSTGPAKPALPRRHRRAILRRDGKCRYPGCERRTLLQIHHLLPKSWGGTDDLANLAAVCAYHHSQLAPHGDWLLTGNPNRVDGLRLIRVDELGSLVADGQPRAGPGP